MNRLFDHERYSAAKKHTPKQRHAYRLETKGADASAMVYTMVEMAKAHNLNIYKYLNYLLEQLPRTAMADEELAKLVHWNDTIQTTCSGTM